MQSPTRSSEGNGRFKPRRPVPCCKLVDIGLLVDRQSTVRRRGIVPDDVATVTDPVCGVAIDPAKAAGRSEHAGVTYHFCSGHCKQAFDRDPARYAGDGAGAGSPHAHHPHEAAPAPPAGTRYTCPMHPQIVRDRPGSCPICGMALEPVVATAAGDDANPELKEMGRRFWVSLALTVPLLALAMGEMIPAARGMVPPH